MTQSTDELENFLQEHAGAYLQGVATYDADGLHWQHTTEETPPDSLPVDHHQLLTELQTTEQYSACGAAFDLGSFVCSLWCYTDGLILPFSHTDDRGTIVVLDADASQKLITFVMECGDHLAATSEWATERTEGPH